MVDMSHRTSLSGNILRLEGKLYTVEPLDDEPTEIGYGYRVETFQFNGRLQEKMDAAKATVFPNSTTPPQCVEREGLIIDYPLRGSGILVCHRPNGELEEIPYDKRNRGQRNMKVVYGKGCYVIWRAYEPGLEFIEICIPPYKLGDLTNLNIDSDNVPEKFRKACLSLMST